MNGCDDEEQANGVAIGSEVLEGEVLIMPYVFTVHFSSTECMTTIFFSQLSNS